MTLYLVIERGSTDDIDDNVYRAFSKKKKKRWILKMN